MNGRTCLLCGKSLSRIWVGAGEDFCSREHRNQYRLRRGMDRLLEANKVATLARKRELPKLILQTSQPSSAPLSHRGFLEPRAPRLWDPAPATADFGRQLAPRMPDVRDHWLTNRLPALPEERRHPAPDPVRFGGRRIPAVLPEIEPARSRFASAAPISPLRQNASDRDVCHTVADLNRPDLRVHLDGAMRRWSRGRTAVAPAGTSPLIVTPPRGYVLRVSMASGFRVPKLLLRDSRMGLRVAQGLQSRARPKLRIRPTPGQAAARSTQTAAIPHIAKCYRPVPAEAHAVVMTWPGAVAAAPVEIRAGVRLRVRVNGRAHVELAPADPKPIAHLAWGMPSSGYVPAERKIAGANAMLRIATVPFGSAADSNGRMSSMEPEGGPNSGMIEERFDQGARNWIGGIKDWSLDAAGARVGSLALFAPSLQWGDFEMEFLTRIENRSVTWIFRAANGSDYLMATLVALPGKGYALTRRAVMQGMAGAAVSSPLSILPNPKAAFTVRMQAKGDEFTVWVDGQKIECWTDARMPTGGIGFLGAPDDRARIYWVRLWPGSSKEQKRG